MKKLSNLSEYILYLYVFLLPWQTRWIIKQGWIAGGTWEYGTYSLYGTEIILIVLILLELFQRKFQPKAPKRQTVSGINLAALTLLIISGLSFFWALNQGLTLYSTVKLLEGVLLLWLISQIKFRISWLARAFIGSVTIQAIIGIGQFLSQQTYSSKWLGMAIHEASELGTFVVDTGSERFLRAYGGLPHPNILAGLLVVAIFIIFGLYFNLYKRVSGWFDRISPEKKNVWSAHRPVILSFTVEIVYYLFCLILCTLALITTFSRAAWLALVIGLVILGLQLVIKKDWPQLISFAKLGFVMLMVFGISWLMFSEPMITRIKSEERLEQISIQSRLSYQEQAYRLLKNNWVVGVGLGNYTQAVYEKIPGRLPSWEYQPVHNIYLLVLVELGVFGLLAFAFLIFEIFRRAYLNLKNTEVLNGWSLAIFSSTVSLLVIGIFDHFIWSLYFGVMLWWLVVGLFRAEKGYTGGVDN